jgi:DNA-binding transcriptional LysR family regulator
VQKRYESKNIPIEILRSFVTVVDTGSYTKAGELLNLSQAAVSAQIARLRRILHGELFTRGAERQLTSRGEIALSYARRIVATNDQLIATAGPRPAPRQLLIGLPRWYDYSRLVELIRACSEADVSEKVTFRCGDVAEFTRDLNTGSVDIAYLANPAEQPGRPVFEWEEPMHWTKSPKLALSQNEAVPLVGWPGTLSERLATKLLADAHIAYNIVFTGADHASRKAAVAAGLGLMLMMRRAMTPELVIADEPFLPPSPIVKTGIYAREGLNLRRITPLVQILEGLLRPPRDSTTPSAPVSPDQGPPRKRHS